MDARRFDAISRAVASRRGLLGRLGLAGAALPLAAAARPALAQDDDVITCEAELVATVRSGQSRDADFGSGNPGELRGTFVITTNKGGRITDGTLTLPDRDEIEVTGQTTGQAI